MKSSSHSRGCLVPGKHHLFLASAHLNPSSGVPGRELQGEDHRQRGRAAWGEASGELREGRAAWGVPPHPGSAEINSKGSHEGKMRSQNAQLERESERRWGKACTTWHGRCWDRRRRTEAAWDPHWDSGSHRAVGPQEWEG